MRRSLLVNLLLLVLIAAIGTGAWAYYEFLYEGAQKLDLQVTIDFKAPPRASKKLTVTENGQTSVIPDRPSAEGGFGIYLNEKYLGRDRITITTDLLRRHGTRIPTTEFYRMKDAMSLVASHFGIDAKPASRSYDPEDGLHGDLIMCTADRLQTWGRMVPVKLIREDDLLDSFYLLAMYEKGEDTGWGALVRFRGEFGVVVRGHSGRGSTAGTTQAPQNQILRTHWTFEPSVSMFPLPLDPEETFQVNTVEASGWWIEQFPPKQDLPR